MKRAVIIGKDVSKGARSPILWNAAFNALDIDAEMTTVDIEHESDAIEFLDSETTKPDFIGGAVAAPLKEVVANILQMIMVVLLSQKIVSLILKASLQQLILIP